MQRNRLQQTFLLTLAVCGLLLAAGLLPSVRVAGITTRKIDILSELKRKNVYQTPDSALPGPFGFRVDGYLSGFERDTAAVKVRPVGEPLVELSRGAQRDSLRLAGPPGGTASGPESGTASGTDSGAAAGSGAAATAASRWPIVDFSPGGDALARFAAAIRSGRQCRIGFFGDSFIEGDILVGDFRERLKEEYGGGGVGFVPLSITSPKFRQTVTQDFSGWTTYTLVNKRKAPEEVREKLTATGIVSVAGAHSVSNFTATNFRGHSKSWNHTEILFINRGERQLEVMVDDTIPHSYTPAQSEDLQIIAIEGRAAKLQIKVTGEGEFIGYGAILENRTGIRVDLHSLRANNGTLGLDCSRDADAEMAAVLDYDLIVLQYGLNAVDAGVTGYAAFGRQLCAVVEHFRAIYPRADILVMGVGDKGGNVDGEFTTLPEVLGMRRAVRNAAEQSGAAYWDTFAAMGGTGSMVRYAESGMAAKDFTHLSYAGGRLIGRRMAEALILDVQGR